MNGQKRLIDASKGGWSDVGRGNVVPNGNNQPVTRIQPKNNPQQVRVVQEPQRPPQRTTYVPKHVVRQPQQQVQHTPQYTVGVNPHANMMYQDTQQHVQQHTPQQHMQQAQQHVQQVHQQPTQQQVHQVPSVDHPQISSPATYKAQPVRKEQKPNVFGYDPEMKNFDLTGCKSIEDIYNKNADRIKIVPE